MTVDKETKAILEHTLPNEQHHSIDVIHGDRGGFCLVRNSRFTNDPVGYYHAQGWITEKDKYAASRLANDSYKAGIYCPKGFELKERVDSTPSRGMGQSQLEARDRYFEAVSCINRLEWQRATVDVSCYGHWLKDLPYIKKRNATANLSESLEAVYNYYLSLRRA